MAARFRPRTILIADLAGCLASISIMILWPNSYTLLWVGSIGLGFSMASVFPTAITLAERRMTITGGISRWFFAGAGLGGMILPWIEGQLFEVIGPQVTMFAILIDLIAAVGVFSILNAKSARIKELSST